MIYLIICVIVVFFVHKCFDITNLYNPFIVFFLYHTFFLFIALSYKDNYKHVVIEDATIVLIVSSYITCVLGAIASSLLFRKMGYNYYKLKDIRYSGTQASYSNYAGYIILFIGFYMATSYIIDTGGLIFFKKDIENTRITDRHGRGLITLLSMSFIIFGYLITLFDNKPGYVKLFLFILSSFFLLSFGNREPMLELALMSFVLLCIYKNIKLKIKYLAYIGIAIFSLMVLFGALRANSTYDAKDLFMAQFGWRPFVNIQNLQWIINFVPKDLEFMHGETMLIELKLFLPGSNPNFGTWLKDTMKLTFDGGSITTTHLGLAYINFGYVGAFLYPFFLGFLFQSIYHSFINRTYNSKLRLLFLFMFSLHVGGTLSSGLVSILIMNIMFLCFVTLCYIGITYLLRLLVFYDKNKRLPDIS